MVIVFKVIEHTVGLRVSAEEEIAGLDVKEHGLASSYADFITCDQMPALESAAPQTPARRAEPAAESGKMSKVVIVTRQSKLNDLMQAFNQIGVTGLTITNVLGCGTQKGATQFYRGVPMEINLLPKVKVEVVVGKVPVQQIIDTARNVLYTGRIGDGKLFVYDIENVVKVRTGEEGIAALQDTCEE